MPDHYMHKRPRPMPQDATRVTPGRMPGPNPLQRYLAWRATNAQQAREWERQHGLGQEAPGMGTTVRGLLSQIPGAENVPDELAGAGEGLLNFLMGSGHPGEFVDAPATAALPFLGRFGKSVLGGATRETGEFVPRTASEIAETIARRGDAVPRPGTAAQRAADARRTVQNAESIADKMPLRQWLDTQWGVLEKGRDPWLMERLREANPAPGELAPFLRRTFNDAISGKIPDAPIDELEMLYRRWNRQPRRQSEWVENWDDLADAVANRIERRLER